jgi:hypothetical protein
MKIAILAAAVMFLTTLTIFAQKGIKDDFSDPEFTKTWISTESTEGLSIWMHGQKYGPEDQYYGIEVLDDQDHRIELDAPEFPADADFLFQVKMTLQFSQQKQDSYGVYFVGADGREVHYIVSAYGSYRITSFKGDEKLTDYTADKPEWIRTDYNIFQIQKMGDGLNLMINGEQIGGDALVGFPIVKFGFGVSKKMIVYIDDFTFVQVQSEEKEVKKKLNEIPAHTSEIDYMSISNDGKVLVTSANDDKEVFVWNPEETIALLPKAVMGSVKNVAKALYPSNRWRDSHDFNEISVTVPENCFVAPDGVTIIPECYDLARSSSVLEAVPGQPFYAADEYNKRTIKMDVDALGKLSNLRYFIEMGEFSSAIDRKGNIYIADGQIYVYDTTGKKIRMIDIPERPTTIQFGGKDGNTLFIATRSSLYGLRVE